VNDPSNINMLDRLKVCAGALKTEAYAMYIAAHTFSPIDLIIMPAESGWQSG